MTFEHQPKLIWHHRVHEAWGESRLCVWRLKFNPTYDRDRIRAALFSTFAVMGVTSYAIYELLGYYDLLMRIWLPNAVSLPRMEEEVGNALIDLAYEDSEYFEVSSIVRHWVWATDEPETPMSFPNPNDLLVKPTTPLLVRINRYVNGDLMHDELTADEQELVQSLQSKSLLTALEPSNGIKYVIVIKRSIAAGSRQARRNLLAEIAKACDGVRAKYGSEISLYDGNIEYLVIGRFPYADFHDGMESLLAALNQSGLANFFLSRTFTAIALQPGFFAYQDLVSVEAAEASGTPPLEDLLLEGETDDREFKASVFANVSRFLNKDEPAPERDRLVALEGVVKTVCGMLNSRLPGTIVVGVGEATRLMERLAVPRRERAQEILGAFTVYGDYVLFGLDMDTWANPGQTWDEYVRSVQQVLSSNITPDPAPYVQISREGFRGKDFMIIRTSPPSTEWFYVEDERSTRFFVRVNAMTRELRGRDQDVFKAARS